MIGNRKRILFGLLALILTVVVHSPAGAGDDRYLVLGSSPLAQSAGTTATDAAVTQALRSGITAALADILGASRVENSLPLMADPILGKPHAYVMGYEIKARTETKARLFLLVEVRINLATLKAALGDLGLNQNMKARLLPLISVSVNGQIPFAWWMTPEDSPPVSLAYATLINKLDQSGTKVVATDQEVPQPAGPVPGIEEALALGQQYQADLVIIGRIEEADTLKGRVAKAKLQLIAVETGEVVGEEIVVGSLAPALEASPQPQPGSQVPADESQPQPEQPARPEVADQTGPSATATDAEARKVAESAAIQLIAQLKASGWGLTIEPVDIRIVVSGIKRFADMRAVITALKSLPQQVQEVRQRAIKAGQATFKAKILTTPRRLADVLLAEDFRTFFISVTKVDAEELQITLIPK